MESNTLIYCSLFISILTGLFTLYFFILKSKLNRRNNEKAEVLGQRERIESRVYELNEIMLSDSKRLFDNTKLLLQYPNKDLTTSLNIPNYSFFQNLGINISNISIDDKTVFCITPFHKKFERTYDAVNQACIKVGYTCVRSDTPYNPGKILQQIVELLLKSQLIVAVLDGKNPNVFYEIGIAHSIGKTVILIANSNKINEIPFDLRSDRLLLYTNYEDLNRKLGEVLKNIHYAD